MLIIYYISNTQKASDTVSCLFITVPWKCQLPLAQYKLNPRVPLPQPSFARHISPVTDTFICSKPLQHPPKPDSVTMNMGGSTFFRNVETNCDREAILCGS